MWIATAILLAVVLSRSVLMNRLTFDTDETRSAMRSFGTAVQIINWTPMDWPPLHNLLLGGWRALVGAHPVMLRFSSLLCFLLAAALVYRVARRLFPGERTALGVMAVHSALGYSIFLSTYLRAYVLAMALFPLAIWLTISYFDRPTWWRALFLSLALAALCYTTYTAIFALAILGVFVLLIYRNAVWRGWLPGLFTAALVAPELIRKAAYFLNRADDASSFSVTLPPIPQAMLEVFQGYAGDAFAVWVALLVLAVLLLGSKRQKSRIIIIAWALITALISPLVLYLIVSIPIIYIFSPRYTWWAMLMFALVIGAGLAYLPPAVWWLTQALVLGIMFLPVLNEPPDGRR